MCKSLASGLLVTEFWRFDRTHFQLVSTPWIFIATKVFGLGHCKHAQLGITKGLPACGPVIPTNRCRKKKHTLLIQRLQHMLQSSWRHSIYDTASAISCATKRLIPIHPHNSHVISQASKMKPLHPCCMLKRKIKTRHGTCHPYCTARSCLIPTQPRALTWHL